MSKTGAGAKLLDVAFDPDGLGGPSSPIDVEIRSIRVGLGMDGSNSLVPKLELTDVVLGDTQWPVLDLASADTPAEVLGAAQNMLRNKLSELFEDDGILQCLGSVLGLCSPRSGAFADIWEGTVGGGNDLRADPFQLVTDPLGCISDYYKQLVTTEIPVPSVASPTCPWLFVFESISMLVKTAIEQMLDGNYSPIIPTMEAPNLEGSGTDRAFTLMGGITESPMVTLTTSYDSSISNPQIGLGLEVIFARLPITHDVDLTLELTGQLADFSFDPNSDSVDADFLNEVGILTVISKQSGTLEITQIGCISLTIDDIRGGVSWSQNSGIEWFVEANEPEINWAYPDMTDENLGFEQLKHVDWDGLILTMPDGTRVEPPSLGPVTYFQGEAEEFELEFVRREVSLDDLRYGSHGFSGPDPSSIDIEVVRGLIGQLLVYKCGSLGFFIGVFFRIHPDIINLNLGGHIIRNDITIPEYYSTVTTGEWPADWKLMHKSDPSSFGLGPLSLPSDWPILDVGDFCSEPWDTLK
jgi:hypothetical protein